MSLTTPEFWSFIASIVSVFLGVGAIGLSVYLFVSSRKTEKQVSNSLVKIETQAEMLQRITGRQLDRLTRFVTEKPPDRTPEPQIQQLLSLLNEIAPKLKADVVQHGESIRLLMVSPRS